MDQKKNKRYTVEEVVALLEEEDEIMSASIAIFPPEDGDVTEEDSGDDEKEDNIPGIDNTSKRQLFSETETSIHTKSKETKTLGFDEQPEPLHSEHVVCDWKKSRLKRNISQFFPEETSPKLPNDAVSVFEMIFTDELLEWMCNMFQTYAAQRYHDFTFKTSKKEVRAWLAILYLSGYVSVPRWRMYWEADSEACCSMVFDAMSRNRFELLKKYSHFSDNSCLDKDDKFSKLRPLIKYLNSKYLDLIEKHLPQQLCIDEAMIPCFGKHSAKQFIQNKPIKYGYKCWCLCDRLGYLIQFEPYQGRPKMFIRVD